MPGNNASNNKLATKSTLRSRIKKHIQQQIADGVYRPGDRIVETQLARELNVSQSPVREAMLELAASGLLEERPYLGTYVRGLTADDILDIFDIRAYIEKYAAERAAIRITEVQLQELEAVLREMEENLDQSYNLSSDLDIKFHELILDASESPSLKRIWTILRMAEWTYLSAKIAQPSMRDLIDQHRTIYSYLHDHSASCAGAYVFLHIKGFGNELSKHFQESTPEPRFAESDHQNAAFDPAKGH